MSSLRPEFIKSWRPLLFEELRADWKHPLLRNNYLFSFAFFALGTPAGPATSILYVGAVIWAIGSIGLYRFEFFDSRAARIVVAIFAAYYLMGIVNATVHWGDRQSLFLIVERLPFLGFVFVLSRLALSRPASIRESIENGALAGAFLAAAVALFQYLSGLNRPEAFTGNANLFAFTSGVAFMICFIAARRHGGFREIVYWTGVLAAFFAVLLSGSKGMLLAVLFCALAVLIFSRTTVADQRISRPLIALGVIASFAIAYVVELPILTRLSDFQTSISFELSGEDNVQGEARSGIWACGIDIALRHPFAGSGYSNAAKQLAECISEDTMSKVSFTHFHNFLIDSAAKGGLLSLVMITIMAIVPIFLMFYNLIFTKEIEIREYIFVFSVSVFIIFIFSGIFNIFLGNDIHDSYYIYLIICICAIIERSKSSSGIFNRKL